MNMKEFMSGMVVFLLIITVLAMVSNLFIVWLAKRNFASGRMKSSRSDYDANLKRNAVVSRAIVSGGIFLASFAYGLERWY